MPQFDMTTAQVKIKPLKVGDAKKIEAALKLLESLLDSDWASAADAWRAAKSEKRTAEKAPLFGRFARLAERIR